MAKPLAVLIVEDVDSDTHLIVRMLKRAGYSLTFEQVETAEQMRRALEKHPWDIVISDFGLPEFDGHAALKAYQEVGLDIPFIVVSGIMGAETAVAMMKAGAHDYVMKGNLARLIPAVERELCQAEMRRVHKQSEETLAKERNLMRTLIDNLPDLIFVKDLASRFVLVNQTSLQTGRQTMAEIIGKSDFEISPPELAARYYADDQAVIHSGQPIIDREERNTSAGTTRWFSTTKAPLRDSEGQIIGLVGMSRDITGRKRTEEALRESLERFELANRATFNAIWDWNLQTDAIWWNENFQTLFGYKPVEIEPGIESWTKRIHPQDLARVEKGIHAAIDSGREFWFDHYRFRRKDGQYVEIEDRGYVSRDASGKPVRMIGAMQDITDRKEVEEALQRETQIMAQVHEGIVATDLKGLIMLWNPGAERLLGYSAQEALGKPISLVYPQDQLSFLAEDIQPQVRKKGWHETEVRFRSKSGKEFPVYLTLAALKDTKGTVIGMIGSAIDITERKQAEEQLAHLHQQLELILGSAGEGILGLDLEGKHTFVNPAAAKMLGYAVEELIGGPSHSIWHHTRPDGTPYPQEECKLHAPYQNGVAQRVDTEVFWKKNGRSFPVDYASTPIYEQGQLTGAVVTFIDITARRQAEEALQLYAEQLEAMVAVRTRALEEAQKLLLRQERLAVLGQIAGGIAHDLRTPLGAIKNAAYLLNLLLEVPDASVKEALDILEHEVNASSRIIDSLLNFAQPRLPARQVVDVGQVVEEALSRVDVPPRVQVEAFEFHRQRTDAALPSILADAGQLEQVFCNLILNAVQAMPRGGRLTIQSRQVSALPPSVGAGFVAEHPDADVAGWIVVSIADSGAGIAQKHLAHLFEPLFTTKPAGIGLGLALVKLLTQANGGCIEVQSEPGKGSTFTVYLPAAQE